jgi:predicted phage terminase large subunit-like protein
MTPKQAEFLCFEGREALYGGSAGGGKSVALLAAALQYIEHPGYNALLMRRTYAQLKKSDSIMSKSLEWLTGRKNAQGQAANWNQTDKTWTFPNGNKLEFGHMQHETNVMDYQGGIWAFIGVDEATQFTERMISFPKSRQRREAGSRLPIRWRGSANPGGVGHAHIKERFIKTKDGRNPGGPDRQFFRATIEDNPNLDREQYIWQLKESGLDPLTLEQMLRGDWDAVIGGRFRKEWLKYYTIKAEFVDQDIQNLWWKPQDQQIFLTIDTAASEERTADYTVIGVWCLSPRADLISLDVWRFQAEIPGILANIKTVVKRWRPAFVAIEEVGAHSGRAIGQILRRSTDPPMVVRSLQPKSQGKLQRATPAIVLASEGRLWLPYNRPGYPLDDVEAELLAFTGLEDAHDDIVDMIAYAASLLPDLGFGISSPKIPHGVGGLLPPSNRPPVVPTGRGVKLPEWARVGVGGVN